MVKLTLERFEPGRLEAVPARLDFLAEGFLVLVSVKNNVEESHHGNI